MFVSVGDSGGYKEKPQLSQQELDLWHFAY